MLAQVLGIIAPDMSYTSSDGTWENVIFNDTEFQKPYDDAYESILYTLTHTEEVRILAFNKLREERNVLLDKSDKYMTRDYPHRLEKDIQDWKEYRQALRDLPTSARPILDADGNLKDVEWPVVPNS